jgi:hypothetical protein
MKKNLFIFVLLVLFSGFAAQNAAMVQEKSTQVEGQTEKKVNLREILNNASVYCEKIKAAALDFVCTENIENKTYFYKITTRRSVSMPGTEGVSNDQFSEGGVATLGEFAEGKNIKLKGTKKNSYKYDYQLIKKDGAPVEQRTLIEENRKKKNKKNAQLKIRYKASSLLFGPVGFLSRYWRNFFKYEVVGTELLEGHNTIVIKAEPTPRNKDNRNFAKIWVDETDFSILQIEWEPQSISGLTEEKEETEVGELKKKVVWRVFYGVEKNGVRFPSKQFIREVYVGAKGKTLPIDEIDFVYDNFKFFQVETETKIK